MSQLLSEATASLDDRFERLFEEQFDYVWTSLRRLGVPARDLDDLTHDVFVEVYRRLATYDPARPIKPWLFAFAFRIASNHRRSARNRAEVLDAPPHEPTSNEPDAEQRIARAETQSAVAWALEKIHVDRRAVFILHEIDECPMQEIASSLGIPLATAYSRLRVAREELTTAVRRWRARGGSHD